MKEKQETTNNNEVYEEDIPFQENWKRYDLETIKRDFCNWLDHNIENEYKSHPNLFMKEEEKRLYIHIQEKGYTDEDPPEDAGYYCIVEPFETKRVEDL